MLKLINIIYWYLAIVVLLAIFNLSYSLYEKIVERNKKRNYKKYKEIIDEEIKNKTDNFDYFKKKLTNVHSLEVYDSIIWELNKNETQKYLKSNDKLYSYLATKYMKKDPIKKAYFAFVIKNYYENANKTSGPIIDFIFKSILDNSIYLRENSMLFLYNNASSELVVNALKNMSDKDLFYSHTLLTDDLLKFKGKPSELKELLLDEFNKFNESYQIAIINYFRFSSNNSKYSKRIFELLTSHEYSNEVEFSLIRYFGKHKYEEAIEYLKKYFNNKSDNDVEYRIVSAYSLGNYEREDVIDTLIKALKDSNYYVRKNAAVSLSNMSNIDINKIKDDKYAYEMYLYITNEKSEGGRA